MVLRLFIVQWEGRGLGMWSRPIVLATTLILYCTFHISCPDSMSKREGISIVLVYQCKL